MNRIIRTVISLILVISAVIFALLLSPADSSISVVFLFVGGAFGILLSCLLYKKGILINKGIIPNVLAALSGLVITLISADLFYNSWKNSSKLQIIIDSVISDYKTGLRILSYALAVIALPFAIYLFMSIIYSCIIVISSINFQEIISLLKECFTVQKIKKNLFYTLISIFTSVFLGTLLLCGVFLLPLERIENNVKQSATVVKDEGTYPELSEWFTSQLDNFTDSLMFLEAADATDSSTLDRAMCVYNGLIENKNPAETLIAHYDQGQAYDSTVPYCRYWHGYLVVLKLLLLVMDYRSMRLINGIIQVVIICSICYLMLKRKIGPYIIPFILSYLMLMPVALAKSFQYSSCFYVFSIGTIALLLTKDKKIICRAKWLFLFIGIGTAYFDFLSYPISTFGIPAVFFLVLTETKPIEKRIVSLIRNAFFWCVGYSGMWLSKWGLATVITGKNIFSDGFETVMVRTSTYDSDGLIHFNPINIEVLNLITFLSTPIALIFFIFVAILLVKCFLIRKELAFIGVAKTILLYVLISIAPFVWYAFTINHSQQHAWFTNKACVVTVAAIGFALISVVKNRDYYANKSHR